MLIVFWIALGFLAIWISTQKGRSAGEGFLLGFLFGPLGVIVEVLLPSRDIATPGRHPPVLRARRPTSPSRGGAPQAHGQEEPQSVLDALGIEEERPPTTNEEFIRRLKVD